MRTAGLALFCVAVTAVVGAAAGQVAIEAKGHRILAEVADTPGARDLGLMFRTAIPADHGMLFVYPNDARHCMWMRNTHIPLSVAFVDDAGEIINIAEMEPESEVNHCAGKPAKYALEMNAGWFKQRGIAAGQRIGGIERAPAAH